MDGPSWGQPEGNGVKKTPLFVALLCHTPVWPSSRASIDGFLTPFALAKLTSTEPTAPSLEVSTHVKIVVASFMQPMMESLSGLSAKAPTGAQLRVLPDQQAGFSSLAQVYSA